MLSWTLLRTFITRLTRKTGIIVVKLQGLKELVMSTQAKKDLAFALKTLVQTTALDKITIDALATKAQVNRNTFYYHFGDIYDLLRWTLEQDIISQVQDHLTAKNWAAKYAIALNYILANKALCLEALHSHQRDLLETFLFELGAQMVQSVVVTIDDDVTPLLAQDLVDFYGSAIASQIIKWLLTDCDTPKDILVSRATAILDGTIEFIINKNKHTNN